MQNKLFSKIYDVRECINGVRIFYLIYLYVAIAIMHFTHAWIEGGHVYVVSIDNKCMHAVSWTVW